jgi:hypothetical protein
MLIVVLASIRVVAVGETIYVDVSGQADLDYIQAGIDAAVNGDMVLVAPGEYVITEPISFRGKAITVQSEAGPDETIIRMGTPSDPKRGSVVVFENNETSASVLEGFTVTGGRGYPRSDLYPPENRWSGTFGGGIMCWDASSTISACTIIQNSAFVGAGVGCLNSNVIITDCRIAENSSEYSGGVCATSGSSLL